MNRSERNGLFDGYFAVDDTAGLEEWKAALGDGTRLQAMVDARQALLASWIAGVSSFPEKDFADATRSELADGTRALKRAATAAEAPAFGRALANGTVGAEHVDVLAKGLRRVKAERRDELLGQVPRLAVLAGSSTPRQFERIVHEAIRRLDSDDGEDRLTAQRKATRLKSWVDQRSGMWRLSGAFDPLTGLGLSGRLHNALATLFNDHVPDDCPPDPEDKQDFLRAHALAALMHGYNSRQPAGSGGRDTSYQASAPTAASSVHPPAPPGQPAPPAEPAQGATPTGPDEAGQSSEPAPPDPDRRPDRGAPSSPNATAHGSSTADGPIAPPAPTLGALGTLGRAEIIVVIDTTQPDADGRPRIDWGLPVELPDRILTDLFTHSATLITPVVVSGGVILHAPGQLDLGRTTRIANRAQRRALRGLYPTCAVPGCRTRYELTKPHHVIWWEHGGRTDLDNLLPLCTHHHHRVHDHGWNLHLSSDRTLTINLPDGRTLTATRQRRKQAA